MIVSILLTGLVLLVLYVASHRLTGLATAAVVAFACFGVVLVIVPDLASRLAVTVGVGRGTDLLLYLFIVGGLFVAANLYFRAKSQEQQIAELTRALALARPLEPHPAGPAAVNGR